MFQNFLARMMSAEDQKSVILRDLSRRILEKFSSHYTQWEGAVNCLAMVDVLLSLAEFARLQSGNICLPDVTYDSNTTVRDFFTIIRDNIINVNV